MEGGGSCWRWAFNTRQWRPGARDWAAAVSLVQSEERERIGRFVFQRDAKAALAGRLLLRRLVTVALGVPWAAATFGRTDHGRPFLHGPMAKKVDFNVSHHGGWAVLAAESCGSGVGGDSCSIEVGVDVMETTRPRNRSIGEFLSTMRRQLSDEEWKYITNINKTTQTQTTEQDNRLKAFYRIWCLKESVLKAKGDGITFGLNRLSFTPSPPLPSPPPTPVTTATTLSIDGVPETRWTFQETMLDSTHPVAVAIHHPSTTHDSSHPIHSFAPHFTDLSFEELTRLAVPLADMDIVIGKDFVAKPEAP